MSIAANLLRPQENTGVVVASPNAFLRKQIVETVSSWQWPVQEAFGGADALNKLEASDCELLLLDQCLPDLDAGELATIIKAQFPGVDVMMLDAETGRAFAPSPLRTASAMYLLRMLERDVGESDPANLAVPERTESGPVYLKGKLEIERLPGMVGQSEPALRMYRMVRLVAPRDTSVLLLGDSGTGKELVAHAIHKLSPRALRPFVVINCAAIPETLLESELFGYTRGAFTGAVQSRIGRIHAAQGGTLFLDEIGDLPLDLQAKLLRFLESGEVQRLGSSDIFKVDVRVVAATNADLQKKVAAGAFRKDLFYRLSVFPIMLPSLSSRRADILPLAEHFLRCLATKPMVLSAEAAAMLERYEWPGNVRELRHVVERATILAENETVLKAEHILITDPGGSFAAF